jgi:hypothetical protein
MRWRDGRVVDGEATIEAAALARPLDERAEPRTGRDSKLPPCRINVPGCKGRRILEPLTGLVDSLDVALPYRYKLLFVGVDASLSDSPLRAAARDAVALSKLFCHFGYWHPEAHHLLTNENATADNVRAALHECVRSEDLDLLLLFWSGHAGPVGSQHVLIANDTRSTSSGLHNAIRLDELTVCMVAGRGVKNRVLILDTCHAGAATEHLNGIPATVNGTQRTVVLAACAANESAREDAEQGFFTRALLDEAKKRAVGIRRRRASTINLLDVFQGAADAVTATHHQQPYVRMHGLGTPLRLPLLRQTALPFEAESEAPVFSRPAA